MRHYYYGWAIVAIGIAVLTLVIGAAIHAFGLFVLPVSREYGLSRAQMNTGMILLNFGMALASPVVGRILDHYPARLVTTASALLFGASFIVLGLSKDLWLSAFVIAVPLAIALVGCGTLTSTLLIARWFTRNRARAMALVSVGFSLGPILVVPMVSMLLPAVGWRQTLIVLGCTIGVCVLLLCTLIRERAEPGVAEPGMEPGMAEPGMASATAPSTAPSMPAPALALRQVIRFPLFWTVALSSAFAFGIQQATIVSMVPFALGAGYTGTQAAALLSVIGAMSISGKLLLAWLGDRFERTALLAFLFALLALTSGALTLAGDYATLLGCCALFGLAMGATTPAFLALLADKFGAASFGVVSGTGSFIATVISAALIRYGGEVYDRTESYRLMFLSFLAVGTVAAVLMGASTSLRQRRASVRPV